MKLLEIFLGDVFSLELFTSDHHKHYLDYHIICCISTFFSIILLRRIVSYVTKVYVRLVKWKKRVGGVKIAVIHHSLRHCCHSLIMNAPLSRKSINFFFFAILFCSLSCVLSRKWRREWIFYRMSSIYNHRTITTTRWLNGKLLSFRASIRIIRK